MKKKILFLLLLVGSLVACSDEQVKKPIAPPVRKEPVDVESYFRNSDSMDSDDDEDDDGAYYDEEDEPIVKVQKKAEFPGGKDELMEYIRENLIYPEAAAEAGIEGTVFVSFIVRRDGTLENIRVMRSSDPLLDDAAIWLVKNMPEWIPARNNGRYVSSYFSLPVTFRLDSR
ncbi:MAG: energy transducer TonB [Paludibacteraceae bacterium]|nr:energy transducer TonB [Paludibacteraceae bacterium]